MLHRLKLKMSHSDNEIRMMRSVENEIKVAVPPSLHPVSSNSSLSSAGEEQVLIARNGLSSAEDLKDNALSALSGKVAVPNTANIKDVIVLPSNVNVHNYNSVLTKRKLESITPFQFKPVPSIVNVVSQQTPILPIAKKPRTVSMSRPSNNETTPAPFLLARPEDSAYLNPLHCFVRENTECFVATAKDIAAPCPGRKNSVSPGQIGLRCIHCRDVFSRNRTKRAICYPSSVSRIYHCVSDMKFDHFSNCKFLPSSERQKFDQLKATCSSKKRGKKVGCGSCNTARYYLDSAKKLGLVDGPQSGVVTLCQPTTSEATNELPNDGTSHSHVVSRQRNTFCVPTSTQGPLPNLTVLPNMRSPATSKQASTERNFQTRLLAVPSDESVLAPIHRFVRRNVEIFAATPEDVAAPAPGRKTRVTVGQIGIRCIHCSKLSPKEKVKRSVCYPPTIMSIYHSVSNMKFDHFGACQGLSKELKEEFATLRATGNQKGGKKINRKTTAQYYIDSAIQDLNLMDTISGIRARNPFATTNAPAPTNLPINVPKLLPLPNFVPMGDALPRITMPTEKARLHTHNHNHTHNPTNGMSILMMAATDPAMREEYEKRKLSRGGGVVSTTMTRKFLPV